MPRWSVFAFPMCVGMLAGNVDAASLSVSPIVVERTAPAVAATLTLSNSGSKPINAQIRIFRWRQTDGKDVLEATSDVVVSPPITTLVANVDYTVRIIRLAKAPVVGEEAYRVLVDELPSARGVSQTSIRLLLRYSIPVFFRAEDSTPDVDWAVRVAGTRTTLGAVNRGAERFKVGKVELTDSSRREINISSGLLGYVLGGSSMRWSVGAPGAPPRPGPGVLHIYNDNVITDVPITIRTGG